MITVVCSNCHGAQWLDGRKCRVCGGAGIVQTVGRASDDEDYLPVPPRERITVRVHVCDLGRAKPPVYP